MFINPFRAHWFHHRPLLILFSPNQSSFLEFNSIVWAIAHYYPPPNLSDSSECLASAQRNDLIPGGNAANSYPA